MKKPVKKLSLKKITLVVLKPNEGKAMQGGVTGKSCFCSRYPLICD